MERSTARKLIDETQAVGASNGWYMMDKLLYLIDRVEASLKAQTEPVAEVPCSDGLYGFAQAITYILCEVEANPNDSLRDIANEALINCNIPLACNEDLSVEPHEGEAR